MNLSAETVDFVHEDNEAEAKPFGGFERHDDTDDSRYNRKENSTSYDLVRVYLNGIGKTALLSAAEEVELSKRIEVGLYAEKVLEATERQEIIETKRGEIKPLETLTQTQQSVYEAIITEGDAARRRLLEANLRLVVSIAKRYQGRGGAGMPLLDLIQEGNLGLVRAMEKFDFAKGFKFSTYATWWIRQSVSRGIADQGRTIRLPSHMVEIVNKLSRIERELRADLGREATDEEIAAEAGLSLDKIKEIKLFARDPVSLNISVGDGDKEDGSELGDFISFTEDENSVEKHVEFQALQEDLNKLIEQTLNPQERDVIRMRFGLDNGKPMTLQQVAEVVGKVRERVRQIEKAAMTKLQSNDALQLLGGYDD